jgi:hypothetical protein
VIVVRLVALQPIQHDAELFAVGDSFSVPDQAAHALTECGAARLDDTPAKAPKRTATPKAEPADLLG